MAGDRLPSAESGTRGPQHPECPGGSRGGTAPSQPRNCRDVARSGCLREEGLQSPLRRDARCTPARCLRAPPCGPALPPPRTLKPHSAPGEPQQRPACPPGKPALQPLEQTGPPPRSLPRPVLRPCCWHCHARRVSVPAHCVSGGRCGLTSRGLTAE